MKRTHSSTKLSNLLPGGLPIDNSSPAFTPAPAQPQLSRMFTVSEVAQYLRLGERPIYKWIAEGRLVASWVGRMHLVSEPNLAAFVKSQESDSSWHQKARDTEKEAN